MNATDLSRLAAEIAIMLLPLSSEERAKVHALVSVLLDEPQQPQHVDSSKPPGPRPPFGRPSGGLSR